MTAPMDPGGRAHPPGYRIDAAAGSDQPSAYPSGYPWPEAGEREIGMSVSDRTELIVRPGKVELAAVIAFALAALWIVLDLLVMGRTSTSDGLGPALVLLSVPFVAALIWGGVAALRGTSGKVLVVVQLVFAGFTTVGVFIGALEQHQLFTPALLGFVVPIIVITRLRHPTAQTWFRSMGGETF